MLTHAPCTVTSAATDVEAKTDGLANHDLAQLIFDAGKFYLSSSKS